MKENLEEDLQIIRIIQQNIDIIVAVLLLSGQITITRVIVEPKGFSLAAGGPLTGRSRLEGVLGIKAFSFLLDVIDIFIAILLLSDQINVSGIFIGPGDFSFNMTGPIFGIPKNQPTLPNIERIFTQFKWIVSDHFHVDPALFIK